MYELNLFDRFAFAAIHAIPVVNPKVEPEFVTTEDIEYRAAPYGLIAVIPKGTPVTPARNLPEPNTFWVEQWKGMSDKAEGWIRNYGFLVSRDQVTDLNA